MPDEFWFTVLGGFLSGLVGLMLFFIQRLKAKKDEQKNILFEILRLFTMPKLYPNIWDKTSLHDQARLYAEQRQEIRNLALRIRDKKLSSLIYLCDMMKRDEKEKCIAAIRKKINKRMYDKIINSAEK
ncbi:MAG: hypothetical protein IMZ61_08415 [Planctomycetes bacterium]|nr:hypothetical protein [Planctomycetota bacterium]